MHCFGIRKQKCFVLPLQVENKLLRLNNLTTEKTIKAKLLRFVIYNEAAYIRCNNFINFIAVAVFIDCASS